MIYQGDCFDYFGEIPDKSVDMVLCDLPYGTLNKKNPNAEWDKPIDLKRLWNEYRRVLKPNGAAVMFGGGYFTAELMTSAPDLWKYNLVWKKGNRPTGFLNANKQPLRLHEDICVFYDKQPTYNPQFTIGLVCHSRGKAGNGLQGRNGCYGDFKQTDAVITNEKYPTSILDFPKEYPQKYHSTQKPVALLEWLIRTYTNKGNTVLDNCMGSGSCGVACVNTGRKFIGIEKNAEFFKTAAERIAKAERDKYDTEKFENLGKMV
ncbi:MAG: site-specific DNA-methyltransferase [Clostridia bacterium]|nr:site-specific DNA-methyltransferase [Clostridia bacterium]